MAVTRKQPSRGWQRNARSGGRVVGGSRLYLRDEYHRQWLAEKVEEFLALKSEIGNGCDPKKLASYGVLKPRDRRMLVEIVAELGGTGNEDAPAHQA